MSVIDDRPTNVRYGVLGFACALATITYLDRVCFGTVAPNIQHEFRLTESEKGWLFTAFAFAYSIFEVPTGWLGDKYGARRTLIRVVLWWSLFTVLTGCVWDFSYNLGYLPMPSFLAEWIGPIPLTFSSLVLLVIIRFLFGVGEAGAYPNIARAFHNWFPFQERGFVKGAVWMASRLAGGMTAFIVYALMYETTTPDGKQEHWRHIFYIFGGIGVAWCVAWWWWFRDRPTDNPRVNAAEIELIQRGVTQHHDKLVVPWRKLLASGNLWLLCVTYFCGAYGWYINITYFTGYLKDPLGIEKGAEKWTAQFWIAGLMAGLPLLVGSVSCLLGGVLTDRFIQRTGNRKWGRRIFGIIGHGMCAVCYFVAIFFMKSPWFFVLLIAFAAFWNDLTMGSSWASCLDIGKRYSGIVAGCMNTVGNLGGALAGILTGKILDWHTSSLPRGPAGAVAGFAEQIAFDTAKNQGWTVNIFLFGMAYVVAVVCWFGFDATKPVAPEEGDGH